MWTSIKTNIISSKLPNSGIARIFVGGGGLCLENVSIFNAMRDTKTSTSSMGFVLHYEKSKYMVLSLLNRNVVGDRLKIKTETLTKEIVLHILVIW